jgi:uncharacterized protein (DUF58 family)
MTDPAMPGAAGTPHVGAPGVVASLHELIALRALAQGGRVHSAPPAAAAPGLHAAPRHNRGMEFSESRPYQSGDDARALDWRQTARRGRPYIKLFQQEHERPVHLLVDLGASMRFGTRVAFKSVVAARMAALLAWHALAAGDRVGALVWNGGQLRAIRPQGRQHGVLTMLACLAEVSALAPAPALHAAGLATPLSTPLSTLARTVRPGSLIVIISDFAMQDADIERQIAALARSAELVLLHVYDGFEAQAPPPGRYRLTDGQRSLTLDLGPAAAREAYGAAFAERRLGLENLARRTGATLVPLATHIAPETVLAPVLLHRAGRRMLPVRSAA